MNPTVCWAKSVLLLCVVLPLPILASRGLLFPAAAIACVGLFVVSCFSRRRFSSDHRFALLSLSAGFVLTYAVNVADVFANPYWTDNGSPEVIDFPHHFGWALVTAEFTQILIVPSVVGFLYIMRHLWTRPRGPGRPPNQRTQRTDGR